VSGTNEFQELDKLRNLRVGRASAWRGEAEAKTGARQVLVGTVADPTSKAQAAPAPVFLNTETF